MRCLRLVVLVGLFVWASYRPGMARAAGPQPPASQPSADVALYRQFVEALTSPAMAGRAVGTPGADLARDYIVERFTEAGLPPAFDASYIQTFSVKFRGPSSQPGRPDETRARPVHNVVGILPGRGRLIGEAIVIAGHYDHIGASSKTQPGGQRVYYPGADDNASGASGVMLIARWLVAREKQLPDSQDRRTIIIASFTGEERGLWGSNYLASHVPTIASTTQPGVRIQPRIVAMLNMDMIGRLRNNRLYVQGSDSGDRWTAVIKAASAGCPLDLRVGGSGNGPSDHAAFYARRIPVLFFITGGHSDVHRPTDTADKINFAGAVSVVRLVEAVCDQLRTDPAPVAYVAPKAQPAVARSGAYMGVVPDMTGSEGDGCLLMNVADNGPADKAGLKTDDVVLKWNGKAITGTRSLLTAVGQSKPGDTVKLQVRRDGKLLDVPLTLGPH